MGIYQCRDHVGRERDCTAPVTVIGLDLYPDLIFLVRVSFRSDTYHCLNGECDQCRRASSVAPAGVRQADPGYFFVDGRGGVVDGFAV